MAYTVIIHLSNEDPVVGEIEELPSPTHMLLKVSNPRRLDGKDLHYLAENVTTVIWPTNRLTFMEVLATKEEDQIIGFVRE